MTLITVGILVDALLFLLAWLAVPVRVELFLGLAFLNMVFFLILLFRIVRRAEKNVRPRSLPLEFVMCNSFMVVTLVIFRMLLEMLHEQCW